MPLDGAFLVVSGLAAAAALAAVTGIVRGLAFRRPEQEASAAALLVLAGACYALSDGGMRYHDLGRQLRAPDRLVTDMVTMAAMFAVLSLLLLLGRSWREAWPRILHRLGTLAACVAGMALCVVSGAGYAQMFAYFTLYVAFLGATSVEVLVLAWRYARGMPRGLPHRACLLLMCAGAAASCVALAGQAAWAVVTAPHLLPPALPAARSCAGLVTPPQCAFTVALPGASVLLPAAGAALPVLAAAAASTWRFWRQVRMLCVLRPLWERLRCTFPQISLPEHGTRGRLDPAFRLYRRVIEIGDGRMMLRPYMRPETSATAAAAAARFGLRGDELRATVEAAVIIAALRARRAAGCYDPAPPDHADGEVPDLPAETAWLVKVARAYTSSPIVYALVTPHR